jgi:hypothetical protein
MGLIARTGRGALVALATVVTTGIASAQAVPKTPQDTGWSVGHEFGRYGTANECAEAATWSDQQHWRDKRPDTVYTKPTGNAAEKTTQATVKGCAARFTAANSAQRELMGVARAALVVNNDAEAEAALSKLVAATTMTTPVKKAWAMYQAVDIYLNAPEPRIPAAMKYVKARSARRPRRSG